MNEYNGKLDDYCWFDFRSRKLQFTLKEVHLKLLKSSCVGWCHGSTGAPGLDTKRPYGNSDVEWDVCEAAGWVPEGDEDDPGGYSASQREAAGKIHNEMDVVLEIVLTTASFTPGVYRLTGYRKWELVKEGE